MGMPQTERLAFPPPDSDTIVVNDRVAYRTEGSVRVISVHGIVFAHYDTTDRTAEAYAMVTLVASGYADQNDVARAFGSSPRSLRRYQARVEASGLAGLMRRPGRPRGTGVQPVHSGRAQTILRLKAKGLSNRAIAGRLAIDEKGVRQTLRRVGWAGPPPAGLPFPDTPARPPSALADGGVVETAVTSVGAAPSPALPARAAVPSSGTLDVDPLDRALDRLLAAMGVLDDAAPLFAPAAALPRAGVLLAVPSLVESGLLSMAATVYGSIGPAFYGLRTTLVAAVLLALLRIPRAETLKEFAPADLGRLVGLDRMPEVKTLRRKLARLASGAQRLGRALAGRRVR